MQKGTGIFGKQYEFGYKNETHAPGSVVRVLFDEMIKLDDDSVGYLYGAYTDLTVRYKAGTRPVLESIVSELGGADDAATIDNIVKFCRNVGIDCDTDTDDFIYGGREEDVIARASYWCTDLARVACVLYQVAGYPSRIIVTANTNYAYCGHTVAEVYYDGKWCLTDPNAGVVFRHGDSSPASAWDVHSDYETANRVYRINDPASVEGNGIFFPPGEQFESVAIVNYYVDDIDKYSYETSGTNEFYRKILQNSDDKWANGLRWIHGEELL